MNSRTFTVVTSLSVICAMASAVFSAFVVNGISAGLIPGHAPLRYFVVPALAVATGLAAIILPLLAIAYGLVSDNSSSNAVSPGPPQAASFDVKSLIPLFILIGFVILFTVVASVL